MNRQGFTLIEFTIVASVLILVMLAIGSLMRAAEDNYLTGMTELSLQDHTQAIAERIAKEVQQSGPSTFFPTPSGTDNLTFQKCMGYSAGSILWGNPISYAFQYETGEIDDGVDNNGNGLIDEGIIVRTENGMSVIIAHWVQGFQFSLSGNVLTIQLVARRRDARGRLLEATAITSVEVKN